MAIRWGEVPRVMSSPSVTTSSGPLTLTAGPAGAAASVEAAPAGYSLAVGLSSDTGPCPPRTVQEAGMAQRVAEIMPTDPVAVPEWTPLTEGARLMRDAGDVVVAEAEPTE
jgi:hypothetical protein